MNHHRLLQAASFFEPQYAQEKPLVSLRIENKNGARFTDRHKLQ
jgi:hypothetical protein